MSPLMPNSLNQNQLILACLRGEEKAQEQLFYMYAGKMMTVCRRYARNHQEAEDLMQEGFIRVFTYLKSYDNAGSFEGWMKKIFVNSALKAISKKSFTNEQSGLENIKEESIEAEVISKLSEEQILKLITELPLGYKTVFNLFVIEGYSHKEISELLNIEESTSRSQLVKARKMLQDRFTEIHKVAI